MTMNSFDECLVYTCDNEEGLCGACIHEERGEDKVKDQIGENSIQMLKKSYPLIC